MEVLEEEKVDVGFVKAVNKKTGDELQEYLQFQRRGSAVQPKKGKGSFKRKPKHPKEGNNED